MFIGRLSQSAVITGSVNRPKWRLVCKSDKHTYVRFKSEQSFIPNE